MSGKTLVAYVTKGGATEKTALEIVNILKEKHKLSVDMVNLRETKPKKLDITSYSNIVAGTGVRMGRIYKQFWKLLDKDLSGKKLALFIVCGEAGDSGKHDKVLEKHLKAILSRHLELKPVEFEVFGGRMKFFGKIVSDECKPEKVKAWAEKVGKKFKGKG